MPSKQYDPKATLFHIRDNISLARSFVEGFDYERFRDDLRTVYAVTRALGIISEASRRLPVEIKQRHPELPWVEMAEAGSVYRHDYEDVRERRLWSALQKDMAPKAGKLFGANRVRIPPGGEVREIHHQLQRPGPARCVDSRSFLRNNM